MSHDLASLLWHVARARGDVSEGILRLLRGRRAPELTLTLTPFRIAVTVDPERVRRLLVTEADRVHKVALEQNVLGPVMQGGLILAEGDEWRRTRTAMAPAFAADLMPQLMTMSSACTAARLDRWSGVVNLSHESRCIVNDVMSRFFGGGAPLGDLPGERALDAFSIDFRDVERALERRIWDRFGLVDRVARLAGRVPVLDPAAPWRAAIARRADQCHRPSGGSGDGAGAPALGRLHAGLESPAVVEREVRTLIGAGATTGHHLAWTAHLLATHPGVQDQLASEIEGFDGAEADGADPAAALTRLEQLPYLSAVLKESLRLYPPAPYMFRRTGDGTLWVIPVWVMQRHPSFWPEPDRFRPERWLEGAEASAYLPFGLGPRLCIGRRFSLIESRAVVLEIVRRYRLSPVGRPPRPKMLIMMRPEADVQVGVARRDGRRSRH